MRIEYWTVTSVFKDSAKWAQLCHVKGIISDIEYQNCEILMSKWLSSLPKVWDVVWLCELQNSEVVVLGTLEQYDLKLLEWEVQLHWWNVSKAWQSKSYNVMAKIKIDKNKNIVIQTLAESWTSNAQITVSSSWAISISWWIVNISAWSAINLTAPVVNVI